MRVNHGGVQGMSWSRRGSEKKRNEYQAEMAGGKLRDGGGSYSLVRHNSAVFEHDFDTNRSSLVHTVSEVREEMQLGLSEGRGREEEGYGSDGWKPAKGLRKGGPQVEGGGGGGGGGLVRQVSRESHEFSQETSFSSSAAPGTKGQINSFVFKNYSLHDRRTLSLPVGKECSINQYVTEMQQQTRLDRESNSRNVTTYSERRSSLSSSSCEGGDVSRLQDFEYEAERHSKSTLFFQAGSTLTTVMAAIFTLYFCIQFLASESIGHRGDEVPLQCKGAAQGISSSSSGSGYSHCRLFAKACPLLGLLTAGLVVVAGTWVSDGRLWQWSQTVLSCGHCDDYDDNRRHAEEAEEKVRQADRSKQQFMAYVFHNIRVPFNAIVLGLGHIRTLEEGGNIVGSGTDKSDLVQMMLDCAETMTSVLDDVTDMGQWEGGQMELHRDEFDILAVIKFLSWGLKDLLEQKEIAFNMNIDDLASKLLTSHRVIGDKQRVVQTLGNFLSNAVKFTPSGGKLDLDLQCEEVVESKNIEDHVVSLSPHLSTEGSLLGATSSQILSKTSSQTKGGVGKVARLRLSVKDNGIGISVEDQAKLFEPYSFVNSGWVLKAGVSGLGLSMAKRFVERCGGSIGVESEEGSGSTFFFSIPFPLAQVDLNSEREQAKLESKLDGGGAVLQKSEVTQSTSSSGVTVVHESITFTRRRASMKDQSKPLVKVKSVDVPNVGDMKENTDCYEKTDSAVHDHNKHEKTPDEGRRKVLLVEDTRINRIILRKVLLNLNLDCEEAENGQVAVDLHRQGRRYDLVLMDKEMPVMDGHEATRLLRKMGVKTPIVALTGNALTTDKQLFFEAGVDDFQTKPLTRERLVQLLSRYGVENSCMKKT